MLHRERAALKKGMVRVKTNEEEQSEEWCERASKYWSESSSTSIHDRETEKSSSFLDTYFFKGQFIYTYEHELTAEPEEYFPGETEDEEARKQNSNRIPDFFCTQLVDELEHNQGWKMRTLERAWLKN